MKHFKLLAILFVASLVAMTSCVVEDDDDDDDEACEVEEYGSVTITNNSGEYWVFDVTYEGSGDTWTTNEEVTIYDGESYTWEEVDAGTVAIWASDPYNDWTISETISLSNCQNYSFYATEKCQLFNTATATVINDAGFTLVVDVYDSNGYVGEETLYDGYEVEYTVAPGDIEFWARDANGSDWSYSDTYSVDECGTFEFTWSASKLANCKKSAKIITNNVSVPVKKNSVIDMETLPAK